MDAKVASVIQELFGRLSAMVTQSQNYEVIQHQSTELGRLRDELERAKLKHSQTVANVQMSGKFEIDAIQNELQALHEEIVLD